MREFKPESILNKKLYNKDEIIFHEKFIEQKTVLGIDIYRYSEFPIGVQEYVPVLFNRLYKETVDHCILNEEFFFQNYGADQDNFKKHFISTGDGGFQILDNPIQAIIFAGYFQLIVRRFNAGKFDEELLANLYNLIGRIELRYAITSEKVFYYDSNFYGPAIINNARILAKDHLNRLLIDYPTIDWFDRTINTIENLLIIKKEDLMKLEYFKSYSDSTDTILFKKKANAQQFRSIDVLKIGNIKSKNSILDIYNVRLQIKLSITDDPGYGAFLVTLGNLNTNGIE